jgi:hypothetical protein
MRRAGHDLEVIALRLAVALEDVASWTVGIVPAGAARMGRRGPRRTSRFEGDAGALATPPVVDARTRRSAAREAAGRLAADAVLARDLGLIAGGARPTGGTVTIGLPDLGLVSAVLDRLRSDADLAPHGVRIVVRVGPARPADRVRHEWAERLDLPLDRVAAVRWPLASDPSDVEATVHLVSPGVVARVLGWIDAIGAQVGRRDLRETS